ncbi:hypothetical protein NL676_003985 [Syzygium grande]|nr:hypothetical protein NL676_003985 [Syzygium grande]
MDAGFIGTRASDLPEAVDGGATDGEVTKVSIAGTSKESMRGLIRGLVSNQESGVFSINEKKLEALEAQS